MSYINNSLEIKKLIKNALAEDIGSGDITSSLLLPLRRNIQASIIAGEDGIVCGIGIACLVFRLCDKKIRVTHKLKDGSRIRRGKVIAKIHGEAISILSAERVALNFLGLLCGIATRTSQFVKKLKRYKVKIMDTRKTIPGLRELEKYAVRIGGGYNHRFGLDDMVLIKENHLSVLNYTSYSLGIEEVIQTAKRKKPKKARLEIEVRSLSEFKQAINSGPDIIMLDNMKIDDIKKALKIRDGLNKLKQNILLEVSGNINLRNICAYAQTGVDIISLGTLTKDIRCLDLSLEVN